MLQITPLIVFVVFFSFFFLIQLTVHFFRFENVTGSENVVSVSARAAPCSAVQHYAEPCNAVQHHAELCTVVQAPCSCLGERRPSTTLPQGQRGMACMETKTLGEF